MCPLFSYVVVVFPFFLLFPKLIVKFQKLAMAAGSKYLLMKVEYET